MTEQTIQVIKRAAEFIEQSLHSGDKPNLSAVAGAAGYSKFHLHRRFAAAAGQTPHAYARRRRLTEAARLLVFSERPLAEIALQSGYASQQAFTLSFKEMYKLPPAEYRKRREFYPLQLPLHLQPPAALAPIRRATAADIPAWLHLARQSVAGYPHWHPEEYCRRLREHIDRRQTLVWPSGQGLAAALAFSAETGCLDFLAVQPQHRRQGLAQILLHTLCRDILPRRELYTTTFRAGDRADCGQRAALERLGFTESEPLVEFGYPTQRYLLPASRRQVIYHV